MTMMLVDEDVLLHSLCQLCFYGAFFSFVSMVGLSAQIVARFLKHDELRIDSESLADSVLSALLLVV